MFRFLRLAGLGLAVGAVFHGTAGAQQRPPAKPPARQEATPAAKAAKAKADSIKKARADSLKKAGADTLQKAGVDTLKKPASDTLKARADSLAAASAAEVKAAMEKAAADSIKQRQDSLRADSVFTDSLQRESQRILREQERRGDTVKAPTPSAEMPHLTDLGDPYRWGRDELAATGALTLGDLLERVPGLTVFRTGWLGSPQVGELLGDLGKVSVF